MWILKSLHPTICCRWFSMVIFSRWAMKLMRTVNLWQLGPFRGAGFHRFWCCLVLNILLSLLGWFLLLILFLRCFLLFNFFFRLLSILRVIVSIVPLFYNCIYICIVATVLLLLWLLLLNLLRASSGSLKFLLKLLLQLLDLLLDRLVLLMIRRCHDVVTWHDAAPVKLLQSQLPKQIVPTLYTD